MSTELGAFAVLSSLLLYLTDLIPRLSQIQSQRTTWLKNREIKVNSRREHANGHSGIRPTKFQLLQSRFMNSNREPYRKRSRDVGKLVIKEKQPTNRNVLNSIVSKLDRSLLTEEESPKITFQEKARWVSCCGKNTVKNVLKKFLAAEEKEAKEKQGTLKKAPNDDLPKIHKKNSVLSILKEKFEQTSNICSAVDVKALLPHKAEKKNKKGLEKKPICKAEIRMLQINLRTVTRFNSPEPEQLVSMTVTMPQLCVATEISHPWSLSTNITHTPQTSDHNPEVQVAKDTQKMQDLKPDKNRMPDRKAHGGQQKGQLQNKCHEIPTVVTDQNDSIENDAASANPGPNPDSISSSQKTLPIAGHIPNTPKKGLNHKENVMLPADNSFSCSEDKNTPQIARKENRSTTCSSSGLAEGISAHQEVKGDETSDISEGMCRPEETKIELAETTKEPPFASQKCFPEQKVLENISPFQCPVAQASCNTEGPPVNEQQSSVEPAAVDKMPQLKPSQENEQDLRSKILDATQNKEKLPDKDETGSTHTENDHTNQVKQEAKPARSQSKESDLQIESKHLFLKPQSQQNEQNNTSPTKETMNQALQFPTSNNSQKNQNKNVKETYVCNNYATAVEDIGKTKICSVNSVTGPQRNSEDTSISVSHLDTSQGLLKEFFSHETQTLEENSGPFSEKCHLSTMDHSAKPESNRAEVNRSLCHVGNLKTPSSNESSNNKSCIQGNKVASHNSEKHHVPSPNEVQKPKAAPGLEEKKVCNFHSGLIKNKNSAARDKDIFPKMLEPPSTKDVRKYEDSPVGETALMHNMETQEEHPRNNTEKQGRAQVMTERKSEKNNSPSLNETAGLGNNAVSKGNLPGTAQWLIPSSVNRREQEDKRVGEQSPVTTSKKILHNSKLPPKSIKDDLTKEGRDTTETNISQAQQLTPPKSNNKKAKPDATEEGRDATKTNISQAQQLTPPKNNSKRAKIDLTKEVRDTRETNISQAQQLTPPKNKTNSRGGSHSTENSKYQTSPNDLEKYDSGKVEDENITKDLLSPLKVPMKYDGTSLEGRKTQDKIQDDKMPSLGDKLKSESKIEKAREQTSKSRQKLLPLKSEHPKTKKTSVSQENILDSFQKDKVNNPVAEQEKPSFSYPRKPDMIAKGEQQALWNSKKDQLPLLEQKVKSHQNKVPSGKKQQQQPQTPKNCVNPKSSLRNEQHAHNSKYNVPSLDELEGNKNAHENKDPSKNTDKQRAPQLSQDRTFQKKKKMLCEADVEPLLGSSRNACTSEHRKTQQSSGKYQIPSPHGLPRHESEEVKKYTVGAVQESKAGLVGLEKYIAESYSEGPTNVSFKPMVIRAIDTIKLDN